MKIVFFIGKGGVGKSTSSALFAYKLAKSGRKVLLASIDPAHNLHDIFECKLSSKASQIIPGLSVIETNLDYWVKKYLKETESELKKVYKYQEVFNLHKYFNILQYSPGLEEYAVLLTLQDTIDKYQNHDYIIFDTPPTALTLKFLALPSISLLWLKELVKFRQMILKKKDIVTKIKTGKKGDDLEKDPVLKRVENLIVNYQDLADQFMDPDNTKIILVMNPDKLSLSESRDIMTKCKNLNLNVPYVILNKFTGDPSILKMLKKEFDGTGILCFNHQDTEITGKATLDNIEVPFDIVGLVE